jgi:hypothetical protein
LLQVIVKTEKGNTSGMSGHLRSVHHELFMALKTSRESNEAFEGENIEEANQKTENVGMHTFLHCKCTLRRLTYFISISFCKFFFLNYFNLKYFITNYYLSKPNHSNCKEDRQLQHLLSHCWCSFV